MLFMFKVILIILILSYSLSLCLSLPLSPCLSLSFNISQYLSFISFYSWLPPPTTMQSCDFWAEKESAKLNMFILPVNTRNTRFPLILWETATSKPGQLA